MAADDEPTAEEREALALARGLVADADTGLLIASLHAGDGGPERARDALALLAELDPDLIVQVALDALINAHLGDPAAARQKRRVVRGGTRPRRSHLRYDPPSVPGTRSLVEPGKLHAGELQAALSNAIVRIMREFYGKGAARSRTMLFDEYVFVVLEDVLTTAEMTLRDGGAGALVQRVRLRFEDLMTATFVGEVERLTGRTVVAYHSQVTLEPSSCFEIFVLDPTQQDDEAQRSEYDVEPVEAAHLQRPGKVGDADQLPSPGEKDPPDRTVARDTSSGPGGAARAAISNAVVRLMNDLYGKGAARTRTFIAEDHVFCALEGVLTRVERTLVQAGETDLVRELRMRFCEMVRPVVADEVARLLGREVLAMQAQVVFDPDTLFLIFVLGDGRSREAAANAGEISGPAR